MGTIHFSYFTLQLGPKTTVHLTDANGTWERAGKKPVKVENEEMNCFVHGSQMVFGLVMPHVFLHEAALKTRKLIRYASLQRDWICFP